MLGSVYKQIIIWIIYTAYLWSFAILMDPNAAFTAFLVKNILLFGFFYFDLFISFPILFKRKKPVLFIIVFIIGLILYYLIRYLATNFLLPLLGENEFKDVVNTRFFSGQAFMYLSYATYALLFWYAQKSKLTERQLRLTEKARLEAEFNHLRTQINPHFLFNTLNTFYSQSLDTLPDTAKGISLLSKIMRYSLEPPGTDGKVPLDDELAHANDYIELMKIRFPDKLQVHNNLPQESQHGWQILPHLLITLVENAFKHGNKDQAFIFDLQLNKEKKQVIFRVENTIAQRPADPGTGVGLRNVRERLQYAYGKAYTFKEEVIDNKYITLMIIPDSYIAPAAEINRQNDPGFNFQFS